MEASQKLQRGCPGVSLLRLGKQTSTFNLKRGSHIGAVEKPIYGGAFLAATKERPCLCAHAARAGARANYGRGGYATAEVEELIATAPSA
jgi:hypothetical protein